MVAVAALLAATQVHVASAWWDKTPRVIANIASRFLREPNKFTRILACDSDRYPMFQSLEDAAVWLQRMPCGDHPGGGYFPCGVLQDKNSHNLRMWQAWSKAEKPYNPKGAELPIKAKFRAAAVGLTSDTSPTAITALSEISKILHSTPTAGWSWAFHLRVALSLISDIHQPLRTMSLYDSAATGGDRGATFANGDDGGKKIKMAVIPNVWLADGLSLFDWWESGAGLLPYQQYGNDQDPFDVAAYADEIMLEHTALEMVEEGRLAKTWNDATDDFGGGWGVGWDSPTLSPQARENGMKGHFETIVADTYKLNEAIYFDYLESEVYGNQTVGWAPGLEYRNKAKHIAGGQMAVAGYRLASWLNFIGQYIPEDVCPANEVSFPLKFAGGIFQGLFAGFVAALLLLLVPGLIAKSFFGVVLARQTSRLTQARTMSTVWVPTSTAKRSPPTANGAPLVAPAEVELS